MTSDIALDSCVIVKLVLTEPDSSRAEALVQTCLAQKQRMRALDFAQIEIGNVIWKSWRRNLLRSDRAAEVLNQLSRFSMVWEPSLPFLARGLELAMQYQISVYDALFVAAVEQWDCRGVTSDAALVRKIQPDFPQIELLYA